MKPPHWYPSTIRAKKGNVFFSGGPQDGLQKLSNHNADLAKRVETLEKPSKMKRVDFDDAPPEALPGSYGDVRQCCAALASESRCFVVRPSGPKDRAYRRQPRTRRRQAATSCVPGLHHPSSTISDGPARKNHHAPFLSRPVDFSGATGLPRTRRRSHFASPSLHPSSRTILDGSARKDHHAHFENRPVDSSGARFSADPNGRHWNAFASHN
ncbi:hypothetical protein QR680_003329 [Steinernema hermaphroditum]|uniref:Uncharacterized protein n=1 Tax=Steinernema hermaphroditum TaxID=289476 RepID=A0AA39LK09_9BILA|nr:hypothetical protein QR680_003329 [Steinernema hermaphroditum]